MNNNLHNQFISNSNKGLLWSVLTENGAFKNIPEEKASIIKSIFDGNINNIANKIVPSDNLINLNKLIIGTMMSEVNNHKVIKMDNIYNASELSQQRQKMFEDELSNKKLEFDKLNNIQVPNKIDFSDNLYTPIGSEMSKILQEQIALRERQLINVLDSQDKEAASKWINPSNQKGNTSYMSSTDTGTGTGNSTGTDNVDQKKIKIGGDIKFDINEINRTKKKVNFEDENKMSSTTSVDTNDFMALLKRKNLQTSINTNEMSNEQVSQAQVSQAQVSHAQVSEGQVSQKKNEPTQLNITEMLKEILEKQNQIITLLTK